MGGSPMDFNSEPLRGYTARSVGDRETIASNIGGQAMFKFTAELRMQLIPNPNVFGLAFFEGGNVWSKTKNFNINDLKRSVGLGVRVFMPLVGIIGFDYGYGFDRFSNIFSAKSSPKWEISYQFGKF
jgi:outer membrane protein insertion porin family